MPGLQFVNVARKRAGKVTWTPPRLVLFVIGRRKKRRCPFWIVKSARTYSRKKAGKFFHVIRLHRSGQVLHLTGGNKKRPHSVLAPMWFISPIVNSKYVRLFRPLLLLFSSFQLVLMHYKADINAPDNDGNTPLHLSTANGHEKVKRKVFYFVLSNRS